MAALPVLVWAPSLVASRYGSAGLGALLARPDEGWRFLADAVLESRGAQLGWADAAMTEASRRWVSRPHAESVSLHWGNGPLAIDTPVGPRRVALRSPLNWIVTGVDRPGAEERVIAVMDYGSGAVVWSLKAERRRAALKAAA